MIARIGRSAYRLGVVLLPAEVRDRAGAAMLETFCEVEEFVIWREPFRWFQ